MGFKHKINWLFIMIVFALLLNLNSLNAAWWDEENIPLPINTEQVKTEKRMLYGSEFNFTYYTSTQGADSIKEFYRNRLPILGWKEKELAKDLGQIEGFKMESSFSNILGQNLIFEKDSDMLIINFMPTGFSKDGKTRFSLSRGNIDLNKPPSPEASAVSELLTKPKKDVTPVYPGASLTNLSESQGSFRATYFTQDDIEDVVSFYKAKMPNYGWYLTGEKPIEKVEFGEAGEYDILEHCPSCSKDTANLAKSMEMWLAELRFSHQSGDICNLVLSNVVAAQGTPDSMNMTTILVNYEEKR